MKIAFIAMSGIRVCDEELLRLGLTLPGFVERSKAVASLPSLGLLTLAGMTPGEHATQYFDVDSPESELDLPMDVSLVAISSLSAQIDQAYSVADRYRAHQVPVVMGGLHVTAEPEEALAHCDAVVVGEGEAVWPSLVADAARGELREMYRSDGTGFDIAQAPMPAFELLDVSKYNRLTVQTSRGCPLRCEFCGGSILLTSQYKQKPVAKVLAEIDRIRELWKRPFIEFADDNSFVNRSYWKQLLPQLASRDVRWFTETDISVGENDELLTLMRAAGCAEVLIGLESPNARDLKGLELRTDWKFKRAKDYGRLVKNIQAHGIRVNACFIVGLDGQGPEVFDAIERYVKALNPYDVQITLPTPFPGTAMYKRLRVERRLFCDRPWKQCTLFDLTFEPSHMSASELRVGFRELAARLFDEQATQHRRRGYEAQRRAHRSV